jgi:hypothetical protein
MDARLDKNRGRKMTKFTWRKARVAVFVLVVLLLTIDGIDWLFTGKTLQGDFWAKWLCVCYGFTLVMGYVEVLVADNRVISKRLDNLTERLERMEERLDNDALQLTDEDLN